MVPSVNRNDKSKTMLNIATKKQSDLAYQLQEHWLQLFFGGKWKLVKDLTLSSHTQEEK